MRIHGICVRIFVFFLQNSDFLNFICIFLSQNDGFTFFFRTLATEMLKKRKMFCNGYFLTLKKTLF